MAQPQALNQQAQTLRSLHVPSNPIVFANVYDAVTAEAVASLHECHALATASKSVALSAGMEDDDLDLPTNLRAIRAIGAVARRHGKPLTADIQDGYGKKLEDAIAQAIDAGAVGVNLEDVDKETQRLIPKDEAAQRVASVMRVAVSKGVPDFVVNARCDVLVKGGPLAEVIERGRSYLNAGATSVFVWGGAARNGITRDEVVKLTEAFGGRLAVSMVLPVGDGLTVDDLRSIGVCRISVGPKLQTRATAYYASEAAKMLK